MSEEKAVESMGAVSDKLVQYMDAAEKIINQYGGDAVDLGLTVFRIEAASDLLSGFLMALTGIIGTILAIKRLFPYLEEKIGDGIGEYLFTGIPLVALIPLGLIGIGGLLDVWSWVGVFWPEAYAVHKFLL